jgi:hypothetical protein
MPISNGPRFAAREDLSDDVAVLLVLSQVRF